MGKKLELEFGIFAKDLKEQLCVCGFNVPSEKVSSWQSIADFILTAHIHKAIGDKQYEKLNILLGKTIADYLKGEAK